MRRWTLLVTLTTTLTLTGSQLMPTTAELRGRQKRWMHDNSHLRDMTQDHIHPWMNNAWYRYIHDRTKAESANTDCYVCSHMPSTSTHPTLYGEYMNHTQAKCAASFAGIGFQHSQITINDIISHAVGLSNGTCDQLFWIDFNVTNRNTSIHFPVFLDQLPGKNHSRCYQQEKGNIPLGNTTNCVETAGEGEGAPVNMSGPSNGTYWVQGMAWLCGQRAYFILPPGWTGTCAPIFLSDHTFRLTAGKEDQRSLNFNHMTRYGEATYLRNSNYGLPDRKYSIHCSPGWELEKICVGLKLWTTVFLNASCKINEQQNQEIDALRIAVMQHRVDLDMILAEKGGLCVLFNNTCCTYIPDNVHSSNMTDGLNALREIQQAQNQDYVSDTSDWFSWLYTGSWLQVLKRLLIGVGVVLLLFCVFVTCILPYLKLMINRIIFSTVAAYIAVKSDDNDSDLLEHEDFV